jgi:hypothetical protein
MSHRRATTARECHLGLDSAKVAHSLFDRSLRRRAGGREIHHIRHWAQGGPTTLSNLALLCRRHPRAVHEEGYQVERMPDGELRFRRPSGWVLPNVPVPPEVAGDPVQAIRARNKAAGLAPHARTAMPGWLGEPLDVRYAIDVLHPLAG